jgi:hypothetical protein
MKPFAIVLIRGDMDEGQIREENLIDVQCKHIQKCHNDSP